MGFIEFIEFIEFLGLKAKNGKCRLFALEFSQPNELYNPNKPYELYFPSSSNATRQWVSTPSSIRSSRKSKRLLCSGAPPGRPTPRQ